MANPLHDMVLYSSSTQLFTSGFSLILESDIDPGYISININPILFREIQIKAFPVCAFS